jgi:hypothetical protein
LRCVVKLMLCDAKEGSLAQQFNESWGMIQTKLPCMVEMRWPRYEVTLHALVDDLNGIGLCTFAGAICNRDPLRRTTCLSSNSDLE